MIYMLAEMGAAVNARDIKGQQPLHLAIKQQQETSVNFLLSLGGDVNALDDNGDTPLHYAVQVSNLRLCKDLCLKGANRKVKNF